MIVAACDDGVVDKGSVYTVVACVFYRERFPVSVRLGCMRVDGLDSTSILGGLIGSDADLVFLDTIVYAGFNIVSLPGLKRVTGSDVIAFYPYEPSYERLSKPVKRHLSNARVRLELLRQLFHIRSLETRRGRVYTVDTLEDDGSVKGWVEKYQFFSPVPEPLRVAHMVASQASRLVYPTTLEKCG